MGSMHLTKTENDRLRTLCKRAVASGDYKSFNELGERAGIGGTTLYPVMKGGGFSPTTAEKISPLLQKYDRSRRERALDPHGASVNLGNGKTLTMNVQRNGRANGHVDGKANGHANGKSNGHSNGHGGTDKRSKALFTKEVLLKLFDLRERTSDAGVLKLIDDTIDRWALDGMHILASMAEHAVSTTH